MTTFMTHKPAPVAYKRSRRDSRDSALTFAVIFDPETGLEAFSGAELLCLLPSQLERDKEHRLNKNKLGDHTLTSKYREPFALFGSRNPQFIDIRSSSAYERCILGRNYDPKNSGSDSSYPPDTPSVYSTDTQSFQNLQRDHTPSTRKFTSTSVSPFPRTTLAPPPKHVPTYNSQRSVYQPATRQASHQVPISANWSDNSHNPPPQVVRVKPHHSGPTNYHNKDSSLAGEPKPRKQKEEKHPIYDTYTAVVVDDEGFFETSSHFDCDPHLNSRFSTTTTSTSTYIALDPYAIPPPSMVGSRQRDPTFLGRRYGTTSKALPPAPQPPRERKLGHAESMIRISNVFKGRWPKRDQDERWVLVEIQSVVTDRILDE